MDCLVENIKPTDCVEDRVASKQLAECVAAHLRIILLTDSRKASESLHLYVF